ncbi:hypothetical protein KIW84_071302 [Lathyrus oleraceus]|uniref:Thymidylate synthase/dCMP hydroxymethylase domain-containing protein n=1 Tax=Pisum sativum TaxID=3888 RepID=A0A9D4VIE9_PEA|nr:hypothetical protein KIW84_071302 [Pisum sativum]
MHSNRLGHYNKHNGGPAKLNQTITVSLKSSGYNLQHNHNHSVFIQSSVDHDAITFFQRVDEFSKLLFLYRQTARHNSAVATFLRKLTDSAMHMKGDLGPVYGLQWRHFGARHANMHDDYADQGFDQLLDVFNKVFLSMFLEMHTFTKLM